jgi:hypothetical protein
MKYKITDLMDLYEDQDCKLTPLDRNMHKIEEKKEIMEVKQSKHRFNWQQGLSVAAAAILVAGLGIGSLYLIKNQNRNRPNDATAPSDPVTISTTVPAPTEGPVSETETTPIETWDDLETLLRKLEQELPNDRFTKVDYDYLYAKIPAGFEAPEGFLPFFSNGQTRIWQDETRILKMDVASGETETLFTVEYGGNDYTKLGGVTANRLYLGSCDADVLEFNLWNAYSVNYQNQDRTDLAGYVSFHSQDGWTLLDSTSQDNLDGGFIVAISPKDAVVRARGVSVHDNCYYCVSCDDDVDFEELRGEIACLSQEEQQNHVLHYSVCKYDADGVKTDVGSFPVTYAEWDAYFRVDPENWVIWRGGLYSPLDISTLRPLSEATPVEELAVEGLDPAREIGSGVQAYHLSHMTALCTDFGLFVFDDWNDGKLLFSVDFNKAFGLNGVPTVLDGSKHGISCGISKGGCTTCEQIVLRYTVSPELNPIYRMIGVETGVCHDPADLSFVNEYSAENIEMDYDYEPAEASWAGADGDTVSTIWFLCEGVDGRVYPFETSEHETKPSETNASARSDLQEQVNSLLSIFALEYVQDSDDLDTEDKLVIFAFEYYVHFENTFSATLEQYNDFLTRTLGKTVSPEDGTTYLEGYITFQDGVFSAGEAYGDPYDNFAVGSVADAASTEVDGKLVYSLNFKVYATIDNEYTATDPDLDLRQLTIEEADALVEAGEIAYVGEGHAEIEDVDGQLRMIRYRRLPSTEQNP